MSIGRIAAFLAVLLSVTAGLHFYIWLRLIRDAAWPSPWSRVATTVVVGLWILLLATFFLMRPASREVIQPLAWISFTWLGVIAILMAFLLPADLVRLFAWGASKLRGEALVNPERRATLARGFSGLVALATFVLSAYSLRRALGPVAIKRVSLPVKRLSPALEGFRIVQLTDVHVGPTIGGDFIRELVEKTNALSPDLVAITGDLVDGSVAELGKFVAPLGELKARHGVFFVTGNHEYYSGVDEWLAFLATLGIRTLRNERLRLDHDGAPIEIAGVDDYTAHQFGRGHGADLKRALSGRDATVPLVLLAHQPKHADEAAALGADVQLSGHTHAGQLFPFSLLVRFDTPYVSGLHRVGEMQLYVSQGTGYWGPPMRLGTEAEISELLLATGTSPTSAP